MRHEASARAWGVHLGPGPVSLAVVDPLHSPVRTKPHPQSHSLIDVGSNYGWHHRPGSPGLGEASECLVVGWCGGSAAAALPLGHSQRQGFCPHRLCVLGQGCGPSVHPCRLPVQTELLSVTCIPVVTGRQVKGKDRKGGGR